jgi:hypothetical protein
MCSCCRVLFFLEFHKIEVRNFLFVVSVSLFAQRSCKRYLPFFFYCNMLPVGFFQNGCQESVVNLDFPFSANSVLHYENWEQFYCHFPLQDK